MTAFDAYDWKNQNRQGYLHAYMIPPTSLNDVYAELLGIDWAASTFTSSYYSDTRTSGTLVVKGKGDEYISPSFIRIVYEIPEWNYKREIGTYAVKQAPATRVNGLWETHFQLHSLLYTMSLDIAAKPMTLAANAWALTAMRTVLTTAHRDSILEDANNRQIGHTQVLESGQSQLSRMFALCNISDNRLDVDGHGRVTVTPYKSPSSRTEQYTIDLGDPRGIAFDDVTRTSNLFELPSESTVIYKWTETTTTGNSSKSETREISSTAYASSDSFVDANVRGYTVTDLHSLTEMSPATTTRAQQLAKTYLENNSHESIEWVLSTKYIPVWEGDVIELVVPDGGLLYAGKHKCLVKNADFTGPCMDVKLTLKELTGGE